MRTDDWMPTRLKLETRNSELSLRKAVLVLAVALSASTLQGATFTVTNTADSGAGSLRQAIIDANANAGLDTIAFNIPGSGVHTIAIASPLSGFTSPVMIDGFTQPGSSPNTNGPGLPDNSVHTIEIDGTNCVGGIAAAVLQFNLGSGGSTVRGLVINRCAARTAIAFFNTGGGNHAEGNFVGTDPTGTTALGNGNGVDMEDQGSGEANDVIGGSTPDKRNLFSGNGTGVLWSGGGTGHHVEGNFIGTDAAGTAALPNYDGVHASYSTANVTIGGTTAAARNVISGNTNVGIFLANAFPAGVDGFQIQGNYIGTDLTGTVALSNFKGVVSNAGTNTIGGSAAGAGNIISGNDDIAVSIGSGATVQGNRIGTNVNGDPLPNRSVGIFAYGSGAIIGGTAAGSGNVIAYNGAVAANGAGVLLPGNGSVNVSIRGNSIYANTSTGSTANRGLGIDLNNDGPTPNDAGDADGGDNNGQNYPIISSVTSLAPQSGTRIQGRFNSTPSTTFDLDFFSNAPCLRHPRDFFQGQTYLGSAQIITDGSGDASIDVTLAASIQPGEAVTATATDPNGNTSEFSHRLVFSMSPTSGPSAGGTDVTLAGTDFIAGASVTIGGQTATNVNVGSSTSITATTPALAAGTSNDLVVTNTDGTAGTLVKGWVADFLDVPGSQQFYAFVTTLVSNAITAGIGGGNYGVDQSTLRQQMAVFLLKAKHGLCYTPPPCTGVFPDVPCPSTFADWIEALFAEGITGGCGGGNYCPGNPVRRDQMAVFLLKAEHGSSYVPPPCTGVFPDVPCPSTFADWIEQLAAEMITGGCGGGNYCPLNPNTRGQMAVFIVKTFNLQ